ncbi:MAG: hypothetical protein JWM72_2206 [Actinomycetia bacterium]|nr:hypothetical protein [Actinomycetes bacterium]MDQ1461638.1 hypothetical protein [Actinomycetota bacterium]
MTERLRSLDARRLRIGIAFLVVAAYGWWFTDRQPFTGGATLALLVPVVVLIAVAEIRRARRPAIAPGADTPKVHPPLFRYAVAVWSALVALLLAWELLALRSSPRSEHPTISSLVESIEQYHVGRLVMFFLWLWLGWTLAS